MPRALPIAWVLLILLQPVRPAWADKAPDAPLCDSAESQDYLTKASGQLLRGTANLAFCWVEVVNQPVVAHREGRSVFGGIFKGFGHTFLRAGRGLGELFLFLDPKHSENGGYPTTANDCALGIIGLEAR